MELQNFVSKDGRQIKSLLQTLRRGRCFCFKVYVYHRLPGQKPGNIARRKLQISKMIVPPRSFMPETPITAVTETTGIEIEKIKRQDCLNSVRLPIPGIIIKRTPPGHQSRNTPKPKQRAPGRKPYFCPTF